MEEKFKEFLKLNPFDFTQQQMENLKAELRNPKENLSSDEKVDFILWTKGLKSRQEYFAEYICRLLSNKKNLKILEVGCGRKVRLSKLLVEKGYNMSAMDPKLEDVSEDVNLIKESFNYENTNILDYDFIIAQEPCDATEHIVRACVKERKDFIINLCGTPHQLINGTLPKSIDEWYTYLENIDDHCCLIFPNIVPGYITPILIGLF